MVMGKENKTEQNIIVGNTNLIQLNNLKIDNVRLFIRKLDFIGYLMCKDLGGAGYTTLDKSHKTKFN